MAEAVKLNYEQAGSGFPLVLVHGFPLDHTIWEPVSERLSGRARVICPDLRGHGRSPAPEGVYTMRLLAGDLARLLDDLGIRRCAMAGHSMGGYAALNFARSYPERLAGLALVASQPAADTEERRQGRIASAAQVAREGAAGFVAAMAPRLVAHAEWVEPLVSLMLKTSPAGIIGALQGMAGREDLSEFLAGLELPVTVIAGEMDGILPLERAQAVAAGLRRGRLVVAAGAGHMPMLENPAAVAEGLALLLDDVEAGGL